MSGQIVIAGLWYAVGKTVSAFIAGLDCGDYVVASNGTITVPYQSDPDQLLTASYLQTVSNQDSNWLVDTEFASTLTVTINGIATQVTVPMVIGFTYTSSGQLVRPNLQAEAKTPKGPTLGLKRRIPQYSMMVTLGPPGALYLGTDNDGLVSATTRPVYFLKADQTTILLASAPFTGVHTGTIENTWSFDAMLGWTISRPYHTVISAVEGFLETSEK